MRSLLSRVIRPVDREIAALAIPALGALAADPLVSLVDTAFVGRLGAAPLGALAVSAAVFGVAFALFNFLAYGTTPLVASAVGRNDLEEAGRHTVAAVALGVSIGVVGAVVLFVAADPVLRTMGAGSDIIDGANTYLRIRVLALPAVMVVTVGHGVFRGFQDTRTPLVVTAGLNAVNLVLDPLFIFGLDGGIAGAAWATVVAQWTGAIWFGWIIFSSRRSELGVSLRLPSWWQMRPLVGAGRSLVIRTGALLGALTLGTAIAARVGTVAVAAHQVASQLWLFLALVVDALAIAGQAMVGRWLAADVARAAEVSRRLLVLGLWVGLLLAATMAALGGVLPGLFSSDPEVVSAVRGIYPFIVAMQPLNALVFVWDGIVIGASAFAFAAGAMVVSGAIAAAVMLLVVPLGWGLAGIWWAIVVLMGVRLVTMVWWSRRGPLAV